MKTYPLTPSQFSALRTRLLEAGITLNAAPGLYQNGVLSYLRIQLKYNYDGVKLTLSILKRPMLISANLIWGQVDGWIGGL